MENTELIKALRCGTVKGDGKLNCPSCNYSHGDCCWTMIMLDAADALESADAYEEAWSKKCERLEKKIAEMKKSYEWKAYAALEESIEGYKTRIAELEAQLQKQDKWMKKSRWYYQQPSQSATINVASQSATINVGTTFLCRSTGKLCPNATEYGYCKNLVCYNPAARG